MSLVITVVLKKRGKGFYKGEYVCVLDPLLNINLKSQIGSIMFLDHFMLNDSQLRDIESIFKVFLWLKSLLFS